MAMNKDTKIVAIIPARGGSKGIPGKNITTVCGHPLIAWSIMQARNSNLIHSVWVTSDSEDILEVAKKYGAKTIKRPEELSGDSATSESAWAHALSEIEVLGQTIEYVVGMQPTSPIRGENDLDNAIESVALNQLDSLLSVVEVEDYFNWRIGPNGLKSINYDYQVRKVRQIIESTYLENGSFYIFRPQILRQLNNRLGGKIGIYLMEKHKMFQIDNVADIKLCEVIMQGYGYANL
jgi:N-acylneuraminate cytidylyltransferase